MSKISWNDYFMSLAFLTSLKTKDPNTAHGSVIIDEQNRVVSLGYNGSVQGIDDTQVPWESREKLDYICHAEFNSILFAQRSLKNCILYVTGHPCTMCTRMICQVGIKQVYFGPVVSRSVDTKSQRISQKLFSLSNVQVTEYKNNLNYVIDMLKSQFNKYFKV